MTKQQQEAYEKFQRALDLQEQGIPRQEIFGMVGYSSIDTLTKAMRKHGYRYNDTHGKYMQEQGCNTTCNTACITKEVEVIPSINTSLQVAPIHNELFKYIQSEQDVLVEMINWYKQYSTTCNTSSTLIKIELPESENTMLSTRSNKVVWEEFKNFAKKNSTHFTMGDLVAQALLDYMKKYE